MEVIERRYTVKRCPDDGAITGLWDGPRWGAVSSLSIDNSMERDPSYTPLAEAKLLYDQKKMYIIFKVVDRYVRTRRTSFQDDVWKDSCVEFFFTPNKDRSTGYFNLEMSAGGVMLLHHRLDRERGVVLVSPEDGKRVEIVSSLPRINDPEIPGPLTWTLEYAVPFEVISRYTEVDYPSPGVVWYANFFKCAEESSHPHWFTWNPILSAKPDFHRKEYFGVLDFL